MSIELKIKSKHLSQEARIIRFEELKLKKQAKWIRDHQGNGASQISNKRNNLYLHRTRDVRFENRATFLARAYIEEKKYSEVEQKRSKDKEYDFQHKVLPRVHAMVKKYGDPDITLDQIRDWLET